MIDFMRLPYVCVLFAFTWRMSSRTRREFTRHGNAIGCRCDDIACKHGFYQASKTVVALDEQAANLPQSFGNDRGWRRMLLAAYFHTQSHVQLRVCSLVDTMPR